MMAKWLWLVVVLTACASATGRDDDDDGDDDDLGGDAGSGVDARAPDGDGALVTPCTPSSWMIEDVGPGGGVPRLVADRDGALHGVSFDAGRNVTYSYLPPGGAWIRTTFHATEAFDEPLEYALAVSDDGTVHVAYTTEIGNTSFPPMELRLASRAPGQAFVEQEFHEFDPVMHPALAAGDALHLLYQGGGYLQEEYSDGGPWMSRRSIFPAGVVSTAVARGGHVHLGLRSGTAAVAPPVYASLAPGGDWTFETFGINGAAPAVALAPDGAVHVAYYDADNRMRHAMRPVGGAWQVEEVPLTYGPNATPSIAVDSAGRVHAILFNATGGESYSIRAAAGGWSVPAHIELVGASIALAPDGTVHMLGLDGSLLRHRWGCPP